MSREELRVSTGLARELMSEGGLPADRADELVGLTVTEATAVISRWLRNAEDE